MRKYHRRLLACYLWAQLFTPLFGLTLICLPTFSAHAQPASIPVKAIKGPIPRDGTNPVWESVPFITVPLVNTTGPTTVRVRAISNGKELGIWLHWKGPEFQDSTQSSQDFPPQAAITFGHRSDGVKEVWGWDAAWQANVVTSLSSTAYPEDSDSNSFWDSYSTQPAEPGAYPDRIGSSLGPFNPGFSTGDTQRIHTAQKPRCPRPTANAFYCTPTPVSGKWGPTESVDGWTVVFSRELKTNNPSDTQFLNGASVPIEFGVWNGRRHVEATMSDISCCYALQMPN